MTATNSAVLSNKQSRLDPQPLDTATAIIGAVQCGPEKVKKSGRRPVVLVNLVDSPWQRLRNVAPRQLLRHWACVSLPLAALTVRAIVQVLMRESLDTRPGSQV
jgi:hypothetical protein